MVNNKFLFGTSQHFNSSIAYMDGDYATIILSIMVAIKAENYAGTMIKIMA